jgi:Fic family protein
VAAPSEAVPVLRADLRVFVNRTHVDAVTQAALAHAQFGTIHPDELVLPGPGATTGSVA